MNINCSIVNKRKIFYLNTKQVTAGGMLLYKIFNGELFLLLICSNGVYEDFGGKAGIKDTTIENTVSREVCEESNYLFDNNNIENRIKCIEPIYIPHSKYVLYILEATIDESLLTPEVFGDKELHDNIQRTVSWISHDDFVNMYFTKKLNPRLKHYAIFQMLTDINKNLIK
jgi:hypothetical protein